MSDQLQKVRNYYRTTTSDYQRYWSRTALHFGYFDQHATTHRQSLERMNEVLAGMAGVKTGARVLDAGCGFGGTALWLAENTGASVTGITIVASQARRARELAARSPSGERLEFIIGDYANTELPGASLDVVIGLESIVHCADKPAFVREAFRLLKPGGRLLIAEYLARDQPPLTSSEQRRLSVFTRGWMMPQLLRPAEYQREMQTVGFENVQIQDLSARVERSLRLCRRNAAPFVPVVGTLCRLHLINSIRRDYTIANYVLYDLFNAGLWRYEVVLATKPI